MASSRGELCEWNFHPRERWCVPFWNFVFQGKNKWMDSFRKGYSIDDTIKVKFVELFFFFFFFLQKIGRNWNSRKDNWHVDDGGVVVDFEGKFVRDDSWCIVILYIDVLFLSDSYLCDIFLIKWYWYARGECLSVDLS